MKVKRYEAATIQGALELVKDDLGPNAFVLSTQRRTKKGLLGLGAKDVFEIQAAAGHNDSTAVQPEKVVLNDNRQTAVAVGQTTRPQVKRSLSVTDDTDDFREMASLLPYAKTAKPTVAPRPTIHRTTTAKPSQPDFQPSIEDELRNLTKTINGIMASGSDRMPSPPRPAKKVAKPELKSRTYHSARINNTEKIATAVKAAPVANVDYLQQMQSHLVESGLDADVIKLLLQPTIDADKKATSFAELRSQISLRLNQLVNTSPEDELLQGGVRAAVLLGPTGVGKTTTIAKLAARAILKHGRSVVLVTLDTYRIGAIKQLATYAEIIGVPLKVAKNVSEIEGIVASAPKDALVLIDTIGRSHLKLNELTDAAEYFRNESQIRKYLILSATTNTRDNIDIAAQFDVFGIDRNIITKTDETLRYGTMINYLARLGRPVDYITTGQNVPEDIRTAGDETITNLLFDGLN